MPRAAGRRAWSTRRRRSSSGPAPGCGSPRSTPWSRSPAPPARGKSSTFNALTGLDLAAVGVRRPTTSWASACIWGGPRVPRTCSSGWASRCGTRPRATPCSTPVVTHVTSRAWSCSTSPTTTRPRSATTSRCERLIVLADLMIWVLDPQKYADKAVHEGFLKPMASHKDVMIVVLNHIDEVPRDRRQGMVEDVKRLLTLDGLDGVPVIATSARDGDGIADAQEADRQAGGRQEGEPVPVPDRRARRGREARRGLRQGHATRPEQRHPVRAQRRRRRRRRGAGGRRRGAALVPDARRPCHRLAADRLALEATPRPAEAAAPRPRCGRQGAGPAATSSVPEATRVQRARVDTAVRHVADEVSEGMSRPVGGRDPQGVGLAGRGLRGRRSTGPWGRPRWGWGRCPGGARRCECSSGC